MPDGAKGLRAGSVLLGQGGVMGWHSTRAREELLIALHGTVQLEIRSSPRTVRRRILKAGQCAFLPARILHRVVNRTAQRARYLYVTAPTRKA